MMADLPLYLASASPRRQDLLTAAGIAFERVGTEVDEDRLSITYDGPIELLAEYLARHKALSGLAALNASGRTGRVLAADTTVLLAGASLAKPHHAADAVAMLRMLRGQAHTVATGVALAGPAHECLVCATSRTRVRMRDYSDAEITRYVATGDPLDKAGAYSIQHPDFQPVAALDGCHLGVIGLPLCLVGALLGHWPELPASTRARARAPRLCPWSDRCRAPLPPASGVHRIPAGLLE